MTARVPPHDLDAEAAVLSSLLLDPAALDVVRERLEPKHFYAEAHQRISEAAYALADAGQPVDVVSVASWLREHGRLQHVGGIEYLAQISDATPAVAHVGHHADTVRTKARTRRVLAECQRLVAEGYAGPAEPEAWCDAAEAAVWAASQENVTQADQPLPVLLQGLVSDVTRRKTQGAGPPGIHCGWALLHQRLNGLLPYLYVVAARPGMGKSSFVAQMARNVAADGRAVVFVSLEMEPAQLAERLVSCEARVDGKRIASGDLSQADFAKVLDAANALTKLPLEFLYRPGATFGQIRSAARRAFRDIEARTGARPGLLAIDYLQLVDDEREKGETRDQAIGRITRGAVALAGELGVPVVLVSQLNRDVEKRPNKRPQLSDLRESGTIEQDAHGVLFLYRDDYYFKDSADRGIAEIDVEKIRNGSPGTVKVRFTAECTRFDTLAPEEYDFDELDNYQPLGGAAA